MKAITICEPYATLIARGIKRVENRTWSTTYRGPIYIHAGKSKEWLTLNEALRLDGTPRLDVAYDIPLSEMHFGCIIAIVKMIDCVHINNIHIPRIADKYPWLADHPHTNGPWCFIFAERPTLIGPWPWRGALGIFPIDEDALGKVANRVLGIAEPTNG